MSDHGGNNNSNNPQNGAGRPLPKKEGDIFKNLVKHYEMKQYKKALKQADMILKKFPKHGETLAMKGLTVNYMVVSSSTTTTATTTTTTATTTTTTATGQQQPQPHTREEAHTLVKEGLKNDMRSHVCWHVYGLLHRSDHDYNEAIKAYKQALKIEPHNLQILRDLSMLQIQLRDTAGYTVTRNTLLTLKPNAKINWLAFCVARHMSGDHHGAIQVIDIYLGTLTEGSYDLGRSYESSELAMYKNSIIAEIPNNYQAALEHLYQCEHIVVDRGAWLIQRLIYELKLHQYPNAQQTVYQLFDRGMTEDHTIHSLFMCQLLQQLQVDKGINNHNDNNTTTTTTTTTTATISDGIIDAVVKLRGTQTLATYIPLSDEQKRTIYHAYQNDLQNRYPKSYAIQRIPITVMDDTQFRSYIDIRCRKDIRRGVPSLCQELKSYLWTLDEEHPTTNRRTTDPIDLLDHPKYQMFVQLVDEYICHLEQSCSKYSSNDNDDDEEEEEEPSTLFWAWYLRAGLHEMVGQYVNGLHYIDKCIEHTPTAVDAYEMKALLLKQSGNIIAAVQCLDYGRDLDRADRYLNNQTTRYMLQANMEQEALTRISMFTRHEGNPEQNLYDMQCSWYELELAACYERKAEYGKSLKKYHAVIQHFHDFQEDQFDFHSYCLRKVTLRSYVNVLRYEDIIYGQEFFVSAAIGTIRIYMYLYDVPTSNVTEEPDYSNMDAAQRKKAKAVARKKKKASEKKESGISTTTTTPTTDTTAANVNNDTTTSSGTATGTNSTTAAAATANNNNSNVPMDDDPLGYEHLKKDPLNEAKKYVQMLIQYAPNDITTWMVQYDVSIRRKKVLLALQALVKATMIDRRNAELFTRVVDFVKNRESYCDRGMDAAASSTNILRTVIDAEISVLMNQCTSIVDYIKQKQTMIHNDPYMDLPMRIAVVKALIDTPECQVTIVEATQYITNYGGMTTARMVTYETCRAALDVLHRCGNDVGNETENNDVKQLWNEEMIQRFPIIHQFIPVDD